MGQSLSHNHIFDQFHHRSHPAPLHHHLNPYFYRHLGLRTDAAVFEFHSPWLKMKTIPLNRMSSPSSYFHSLHLMSDSDSACSQMMLICCVDLNDVDHWWTVDDDCLISLNPFSIAPGSHLLWLLLLILIYQLIRRRRWLFRWSSSSLFHCYYYLLKQFYHGTSYYSQKYHYYD